MHRNIFYYAKDKMKVKNFLLLFFMGSLFFSCKLFTTDVSGYLSSGQNAGSLSYTLSADKTYYSVGGTNKCSGVVYIPEIYNGISVTHIKEKGFMGNSNITNIDIPDTITSIGDSAFEDCTSLKTIIVPSGVMNINSSVFSGCTAATVYIDRTSYTDGEFDDVVQTLYKGAWFKISFETNGGGYISPKGVVGSQSVLPDFLPNVTKAGSIFAGWYVDAEFENAFQHNQLIKSDMVLYAKWSD